MTNLDKDPVSGVWGWRINIDAIHKSMGVLAQFESGRRQGEAVGLERLASTVHDGKEELEAYKGDVSTSGCVVVMVVVVVVVVVLVLVVIIVAVVFLVLLL